MNRMKESERGVWDSHNNVVEVGAHASAEKRWGIILRCPRA